MLNADQTKASDEITLCGAARFLAAIFCTDEHTILRHWGIKDFHYCSDCGIKLRQGTKSGYCRICQMKRNIIMVECEECHTLFPRRTYQVALKHYQGHCFCNRKCFGKWVSKRSGFTFHPENIVPRKYDHDMVWQKRLETGYGSIRLSRLLNIPSGSISYILRTKRKELSHGINSDSSLHRPAPLLGRKHTDSHCEML